MLISMGPSDQKDVTSLSARVRSIAPSSTLAVGQRAAELKRSGVDVLVFASGEPDFTTPERIREAAIQALHDGDTHYAPVPGDPETRTAVAEKLTNENHIPGVSHDHVVISPGGKQSLYLVFQSLLDPGDEVVLPTPSWVSYAPQIELAGGSVVRIPTQASSGFKITATQLENVITPRTKAIVLNTPSNPCGTAYTQDELQALAGVIHDASENSLADITVISDEIYEKLVYGDTKHVSMGSLGNMAERTITVNGMSKAYAMTGWRLGYLAGSGERGRLLVNACKKVQSQLNTSVATFTLPAMRVALRECGDEVERMRAAYERRGTLMHGLLAKIDGITCPEPTGAFYCFADVSAHFGKTNAHGAVIDSAKSFAQALLEDQHVACVPGEDFGSPGDRCLRFTFACSEENIESGMSKLKAFIESLS